MACCMTCCHGSLPALQRSTVHAWDSLLPCMSSHDLHTFSATEAHALGGQLDMLPMVLALGPVKPLATAVWDLLARAHVHFF